MVTGDSIDRYRKISRSFEIPKNEALPGTRHRSSGEGRRAAIEEGVILINVSLNGRVNDHLGPRTYSLTFSKRRQGPLASSKEFRVVLRPPRLAKERSL